MNIFDKTSVFMLSINEKKFIVLYGIIILLEQIIGSSSQYATIYYIAKPAILISLISFFWNSSRHLAFRTRLITLAALCCSLIGDILLMFVEVSDYFFIGGLVAFLIAHMMYILVFLEKRKLDKSIGLYMSFLIIYAIGLFAILKNGLGEMLIPVIFYIMIILAMATTAFMRKNNVNKLSFNLVLIGAILFVISDSLLAINKFYLPFKFANTGIMITYALAQLFIVFGINKQR